jgi:hypothetical protein
VQQTNRLTNLQLYARWARDDATAWQRLLGTRVTHLSRGDGEVTDVSADADAVTVLVQYTRGHRRHPLWEFRTEIIRLALPVGLTRDELIKLTATPPDQTAEVPLPRERLAPNGTARPRLWTRWSVPAPATIVTPA